MLLDATPAAPALSPVSLRPSLGLRHGLLAGILFAVLILLVRVGLRLFIAEEVRGTARFVTLFIYGQLGLAALLQASAAAMAAARVCRAGITHGMFAAFVGGSVMVVGILAISLLFGGTLNVAFVGSIFTQIVNAGALLALPAAAGAAAAVEWWKWMRRHDKRLAQPAQG
jgi:hypothetical protein